MFWEKCKNKIYFFLNILSVVIKIFWRSPRVSVLMYHSIGDSQVLFAVKMRDFERHLEFLKQEGYIVIALSRLISALKHGQRLSDKTVVLTFDDAYRDNYTDAWSLLKKYNFPATIFLPTAFIGKAMKNSQGIEIEILNEEQIKEMVESGLIEFGSHTHSHPRLKEISDEIFNEELKTSKDIIERITGKPCRFFAYPKGQFRASFEKILVENGFIAALTVQEGLIGQIDNLFLLKRNFIYSAGGFNQFKGKLTYSVLAYNFLKKLIKF
jgi:peptidoglycan/xylan/chitin deacetylase (PgdA/CDA1 family)